ncbi:MAG: hypothetical protein EPN55_04960 [Gammaproteobacteria bacterium]|nr:MAG: hypothetical protein EPN55_04960 [Gammaproteobacteria bacterium]
MDRQQKQQCHNPLVFAKRRRRGGTMPSNFLGIAVAFGIVVALSACTDQAVQPTKQTSSSEEIKLPFVKTESSPCFAKANRDDKLHCLFATYQYEKEICPKLATQVAATTDMTNTLDSLLDVKKRFSLYEHLLNGPIKENEAVAYVRNHWGYFEIDVSYHGGPGNESYLKNLPLYCAPSIRRLNDIESLGPSDIAWKVRVEWLNQYLKVMAWPWTEAYGYPPEWLLDEFDKVKNIYNRPEDKKRLTDWVVSTEKFFFEKAAKHAADGWAGRTKDQQIEILKGWIAKLRAGI